MQINFYSGDIRNADMPSEFLGSVYFKRRFGEGRIRLEVRVCLCVWWWWWWWRGKRGWDELERGEMYTIVMGLYTIVMGLYTIVMGLYTIVMG